MNIAYRFNYGNYGFNSQSFNIKPVLKSLVAVGALALSLTGAKAQMVPSPYGVQLGSTPGITFLPATPYNGSLSTYSGYGAYRAIGGSPYGFQGYVNPYGVSNYAPLGGYVFPSGNNALPVSAWNNAIPLSNYSNAIPLGGGIDYMNPYYGGVTVTQGNGAEYVGPRGNYDPYVNLNATNNPVYSGENEAEYQAQYSAYLNAQRAMAIAQAQQPASLAQSLAVQRQRNYGLTFAWRNGARPILAMNVTLLNNLHLPVAHASGGYGDPAVFDPNAYTYSARYYRVDVTYADGTQESTQGTIRPTR